MSKQLAFLTRLTQDELFSLYFQTFPTSTSQTCSSENTTVMTEIAIQALRSPGK